MNQEEIEEIATSAYNRGIDSGFAAGMAAKEVYYRDAYGDDFEEILRNHDTGFKGLFDENGEER